MTSRLLSKNIMKCYLFLLIVWEINVPAKDRPSNKKATKKMISFLSRLRPEISLRRQFRCANGIPHDYCFSLRNINFISLGHQWNGQVSGELFLFSFLNFHIRPMCWNFDFFGAIYLAFFTTQSRHEELAIPFKNVWKWNSSNSFPLSRCLKFKTDYRVKVSRMIIGWSAVLQHHALDAFIVKVTTRHTTRENQTPVQC